MEILGWILIFVTAPIWLLLLGGTIAVTIELWVTLYKILVR